MFFQILARGIEQIDRSFVSVSGVDAHETVKKYPNNKLSSHYKSSRRLGGSSLSRLKVTFLQAFLCSGLGSPSLVERPPLFFSPHDCRYL